MVIDWFTVVAQIANFIILVWLLRRYLYGPVLAAIDARERLIAEQILRADEKVAEASAAHDEYRAASERLAEQKAALLLAAEDEAKQAGQRMVEAVRETARSLRADYESSLRRDAVAFGLSLSRRIQAESLEMARKILLELASMTLESAMTTVLVSRLRGLDNQTKMTMSEAIRRSSSGLLVQSAFDMDESARATVRAAIAECFATEAQVSFERNGDLICGVQLIADSRRLGWGVDPYLNSLEHDVSVLLEAQWSSDSVDRVDSASPGEAQ